MYYTTATTTSREKKIPRAQDMLQCISSPYAIHQAAAPVCQKRRKKTEAQDASVSQALFIAEVVVVCIHLHHVDKL